MKIQDLHSVIRSALIYDVDDEGNTDKVVEMIFNGVIKVLERDARFPRLTRADYDLLFADLIKETSEVLLPYQKIDAKDAAEIIVGAVIDEMSEKADEHRKNSEADQIAVVE
jgi:hypothetical protein